MWPDGNVIFQYLAIYLLQWKIAPQHKKLAKVGSKLCQILSQDNPLKYCQRLYEFCQNDRVLPNMVTLCNDSVTHPPTYLPSYLPTYRKYFYNKGRKEPAEVNTHAWWHFCAHIEGWVTQRRWCISHTNPSTYLPISHTYPSTYLPMSHSNIPISQQSNSIVKIS